MVKEKEKKIYINFPTQWEAFKKRSNGIVHASPSYMGNILIYYAGTIYNNTNNGT